jgi:hypothetical protein
MKSTDLKAILASIACLFISTSAFAAEGSSDGVPSLKAGSGFTKVYSVKNVAVEAATKEGGSLKITVSGEATTPSWEDPHLSACIYTTKPKDGIYSFDLVAKRPTGIVPQYVAPISAKVFVWHNFPSDLKGIRVIAKSNSVEKLLEAK